MSHTVTIQAELKDPAALEAACRRLNLPLPTRGKVQLFDRIAEGTGIQLDGWRFPICLTPQGEILFDNFGGFWGLPERLDELVDLLTSLETDQFWFVTVHRKSTSAAL